MYTLELNLFVVCMSETVWFQVDQGLFQGNIHVLCIVKEDLIITLGCIIIHGSDEKMAV